MKKRIFAVLLAMAVMLSLAMFASCTGGDGDDEEAEEEVTITVHVTVTGNDGKVLVDDDVVLTGVPSQNTAFAAAKKALDAADVNYKEHDGMFDAIGEYEDVTFEDLVLEEDEEMPEGVGIYWEVMINGKDESGSDRVADGDSVEYIFRTVMSWKEE